MSSQKEFITFREVQIQSLQGKIEAYSDSVQKLERYLPYQNDVILKRFLTAYLAYLKDQKEILERRLRNLMPVKNTNNYDKHIQ